MKRHPNEMFPFGANGDGFVEHNSGVGEGVGYVADIQDGNGGVDFMDYGETAEEYPWPDERSPQQDVYEDLSPSGYE